MLIAFKTVGGCSSTGTPDGNQYLYSLPAQEFIHLQSEQFCPSFIHFISLPLSDLNTSREEVVEDVDSFLHQPNVRQCGVGTLAVLDGVNEAVPEFTQRTQQVPLYKIHHTVIWRVEHQQLGIQLKCDVIGILTTTINTPNCL